MTTPPAPAAPMSETSGSPITHHASRITDPIPAIQMEGVAAGSINDPNAVVAEDIHWTVNAGDYWAIAGLQGSGKTDLLMMTASLVAPMRGSYRFFGETMPIFEEDRLPARLRLGLVFDGGQLFNLLTVRQNVALPLRYHRNLAPAQVEADVNQLLELTELGPWADSTPGAMGRNWRQRVGLARALILQPEVLLLDNPLGGLDPRHANWWLNFLEQLSQGHPLITGRPVTLVVTTADLPPWKTRARQFAMLKDKHFKVGPWSEEVMA